MRLEAATSGEKGGASTVVLGRPWLSDTVFHAFRGLDFSSCFSLLALTLHIVRWQMNYNNAYKGAWPRRVDAHLRRADACLRLRARP